MNTLRRIIFVTSSVGFLGICTLFAHASVLTPPSITVGPIEKFYASDSCGGTGCSGTFNWTSSFAANSSTVLLSTTAPSWSGDAGVGNSTRLFAPTIKAETSTPNGVYFGGDGTPTGTVNQIPYVAFRDVGNNLGVWRDSYQFTTLTGGTVTALDATSNNDIWAGIDIGPGGAGGSGTKVEHSIDGGKNWSEVTNSFGSLYIKKIIAINPYNVVALTTTGAGSTVWRYDGTSWVSLNYISAECETMAVAADGIWLGCMDGTIRHWTVATSPWTSTTIDSTHTAVKFYSLLASSDGVHLWALGMGTPTGGSVPFGVLYTYNRSTSIWTNIPISTTPQFDFYFDTQASMISATSFLVPAYPHAATSITSGMVWKYESTTNTWTNTNGGDIVDGVDAFAQDDYIAWGHIYNLIYDYELSPTTIVSVPGSGTVHSIKVPNLSPSTRYYYSVRSTSTAGGLQAGKFGGSFTPGASEADPSCVEVWTCTAWTACSAGTQSRTCSDTNACGTTATRPALTQDCSGGDTVPPVISVTTPVNGATISGTVPITSTATDNVGVIGVQFKLDGNNLQAEDTSAPFSIDWNTTTVTKGLHTVTAVARDAAGWTTTSTPVTVTVISPDSEKPTDTITAPSPLTGVVSTSSTIHVAGTATDDVEVSKVEIQVVDNGVTYPWLLATGTPGTTMDWSADVPLYSDASLNIVTVKTTDSSGNVFSQSFDVTYALPNFTLSITPASQNVLGTTPAITTVYTVKVQAESGFTGRVNLTFSGAPRAASASTPAKLSVTTNTGGSWTSTLTVPTDTGDVQIDPYTITVNGTSPDTTVVRSVTAKLTVDSAADFSVSATPGSKTVNRGTDAIYTLNMSGSSTFKTNATAPTFSNSPLPAGTTIAYGAYAGDPSTSGSATKKVTISSTATTPPTNSPITFTVTYTKADGSLVSHTAILTLIVQKPGAFTIDLNSASAAVTAGSVTALDSSTYFNIVVTAVNGFTDPVHLSVTPDFGVFTTPPDSSVTFTPNDFVPSDTGTLVTMNIHIDSTFGCMATCTDALMISGTSGSMTVNASASLVVTPDTTPPTITSPVALPVTAPVGLPGTASVLINWQTDELANSQITIFDSSTETMTAVVGTAGNFGVYCTSACHALQYDGLIPNRTYFYTITSVDRAYASLGWLSPPPPNATTLTKVNGLLLSFTTSEAPDIQKPIITNLLPASGSSVVGTTTISADASDNSPLSKITMQIFSETSSTALVDTSYDCVATTCSLNYQWDTMQKSPKFPNGKYMITVQAISTKGNADSIMSDPLSTTVTVGNDTTPPNIECLPGQTICQPQTVTPAVCDAVTGKCTVDIEWQTDDSSTSEVEYGLATDCTQYITRPDGTSIPCSYTNLQEYDSSNPSNGNPDYTHHVVHLSNLDAGKLYHYRITSCNLSNLCTN